MTNNCDEEIKNEQIFSSILDHRKDSSALSKKNAFFTTESGYKKRKRTTKGWELLVQWKNMSTNWLPLKDVKEAHILEVAKYAEMNDIADEPAYAWWIPTILKKKIMMISKIKHKYWKISHKYGVRLPHLVEEALELDKENNNDLWYQAILKEMKNVKGAFQEYKKCPDPQELQNNPKILVGF